MFVCMLTHIIKCLQPHYNIISALFLDLHTDADTVKDSPTDYFTRLFI